MFGDDDDDDDDEDDDFEDRSSLPAQGIVNDAETKALDVSICVQNSLLCRFIVYFDFCH